MFSRVKGTRDFLDLTLFDFFIKKTSIHVENYNFEHIDTPILETTELFKRSLGTNTDVVNKEMYVFEGSEEGEKSICLRPEVTASTMRAFLENNISSLPWKVYSWGPMFRKERPQRGRYRQFHQFNIEAIGSGEISLDANFIAMLDHLFSEALMLDNYTVHVNFLGSPDDRKVYKTILGDFLDKNNSALCGKCKERREKNIMRVFDCKQEDCQKLYKKAPYIVDSLSEESKKEWEQLQSLLELLSISFSYTPTLVRGLDYYNKTVFEFSSTALGAQSAFCGGGRYDYLAQELGSKECYPSFGVAIGIERVLILLEQIKDKLPLPHKKPLHLFLPLSENQYSLASLLADHVQAANLCVDILFDKPSLKSMMRKANKMGASYVLLVGDDEQKNNTVVVKNMVSGTEETIAQNDLVGHLKK
ncbi:histidine--tRNA ligase [bacterium]|jgi:histidyl-tRNA synthetase|nr:histidine--tRNA ligase [bacterium]